jgi:hypothetical protein
MRVCDDMKGIPIHPDCKESQRAGCPHSWQTFPAEAAILSPDRSNQAPPIVKILHLIRQTPTTLLVACVSFTGAEAAEKTFSRFRFTPVELRDDAGADSVQLSEFELKLDGDNLDLSTATISNPGGDNPAGEEVEFIADQDTGTKWLDFERGPVIFQFAAPVTIDRYRFATAGDEPGRDPVKWTFEGSDDGVAWTLLDQRNNYPVPFIREAFTGDIVIAEDLNFAILDFRIDQPVLLNGTSAELSWDVVNADTITIEPGLGTVLDAGMDVVSPPDGADTAYVLTAIRDGKPPQSRTVTVRTVEGGAASYRYVRFTPLKLRDNPMANSVQLAEFAFSGVGGPVTVAAVTNPGGDNPNNEIPSSVIDGQSGTKWLDLNKGGLIFDFGSTQSFDSYRLTTAGDATERDPVRWILEGSSDAITWALIENFTAWDYPIPENRSTATEPIPLPGPSLRPLAPLAITASSIDTANQRISLSFRTLPGRL